MLTRQRERGAQIVADYVKNPANATSCTKRLEPETAGKPKSIENAKIGPIP